VAYVLVLKEIKKKIVPPLNDDLAKEVGNFQSLDELRAKVVEELARRSKESQEAETRDKILTHLVAEHNFEVPESLIQAQIDGRLEGIVREMMSRGIDPTKAPVNWQEEREKIRPAATEMVRAGLILESIAVQEGIETTEEDLNVWLREEARRAGTTPNALKEQLAENGRLAGVRRQIVREKSLDFLLRDATITHEGK